MKVLAVLLLCALVAVQGRSAVEKSSRSVAVLGESPWVVHLRIAVATSGYLNSAVGSLISDRWVLTAAEAVEDVRFIWIRYGAVNVISPSLVTESSTARFSSDNKVAVISLNRVVQFTDNIAPVALADVSAPDSATFHYYGENDGVPGEVLKYFTVTLVEEEDDIIAQSDDGKASKFDLGAPLVSEGVQIGVLVTEGDDEKAGGFVSVAGYLDWIQEETGLELSSRSAQPEDSLRVNFVN